MKRNIYKIHYLLIGLTVWLIAGSGCIKERAEIPTWIEIDSLSFNPAGAPLTYSSRFTDAWVYVNSNLVGGFELPARVPILAEGNTDIIIYPGIQVNGLTALRSPYLKIQRYQDTLNLVPGETIKLNPTYVIDPSLIVDAQTISEHFRYTENFQSGNGSSSLQPTSGSYGNFYIYDGPGAFQGNRCGLLRHDGADNTLAQVDNSQWFTLPKGDVGGIFFEMNYRCNTTFTVSLLAKPSDGGAIQKIGVIGINETDVWKKIYIALSPTANSFTTGNEFKLALGYVRQPDIAVQEVYLDNLQIFY